MKRILLTAAALAVVAPAQAFWFGDMYCYLETRRKENNRWPEQFVEPDRRAAAAPFEIMVRNGWRRQNLLGGHHFSDDGTQLTQAGKLRVQWILTQNPAQYRQVFVERAVNEGTNEARLATVNDFATQFEDGSLDSAQQTHIVSDGRPAVTVDFVNTKFRENMPIPTLPQSATPSAD